METNTIIRIILSVVLSLFLLALIGRKTRENFESGSGSQIVGSVAENSEQFEGVRLVLRASSEKRARLSGFALQARCHFRRIRGVVIKSWFLFGQSVSQPPPI